MVQASPDAPKVGVGVFVFRNGVFLMGKRRGAHGEGTWSVPGGHLEFGESLEETARREVKEETSILIDNVRFGAVTNDVFDEEGKHYVTVWMLSDYRAGEPTITEPEKYDHQGWYDFSGLPEPLFLPWRQLLRSTFVQNIRAQLGSSRGPLG
jgi:8-oxo-dGTP diphosphatase